MYKDRAAWAKEKVVMKKRFAERKRAMDKKLTPQQLEKGMWHAMHYALRKTIASADDNLPKSDPSDSYIYKFVYKYKAHQWIDANIPVPKSTDALEALASCQKKKHPKFYEEDGEKTIRVYKLRKEIISAFQIDEHDNPLPVIPIHEPIHEPDSTTYSGRTLVRTNLPITTMRKDRQFEQTPIVEMSFPDEKKGLL